MYVLCNSTTLPAAAGARLNASAAAAATESTKGSSQDETTLRNAAHPAWGNRLEQGVQNPGPGTAGTWFKPNGLAASTAGNK